jgi:hypothetical protein
LFVVPILLPTGVVCFFHPIRPLLVGGVFVKVRGVLRPTLGEPSGRFIPRRFLRDFVKVIMALGTVVPVLGPIFFRGRIAERLGEEKGGGEKQTIENKGVRSTGNHAV